MNQHLNRLIFGDRETVAGTVYGTIIVMSVLAAGAKAYQHNLWRLVVLRAGALSFSGSRTFTPTPSGRVSRPDVAPPSPSFRRLPVGNTRLWPRRFSRWPPLGLGAAGVLAERTGVQASPIFRVTAR